MSQAREIITEGLAQRARAGIKVRQPLASVSAPNLDETYQNIIAEELNVKEVKHGENVQVDTSLTPDLKSEGLMRELVRVIQNARKKAALNVDDRIKLGIHSDSKELIEAYTKFKNLIDEETLTKAELGKTKAEHSETVKIDGQEVKISLARV